MRILVIALAFGLIGCVDETTPEGIDGIEEEFDDLGPDTHKSDVDETEPTDDVAPPVPFTDNGLELTPGQPNDIVPSPTRDHTPTLIETQKLTPVPPTRDRTPTLIKDQKLTPVPASRTRPPQL